MWRSGAHSQLSERRDIGTGGKDRDRETRV